MGAPGLFPHRSSQSKPGRKSLATLVLLFIGIVVLLRPQLSGLRSGQALGGPAPAVMPAGGSQMQAAGPSSAPAPSSGSQLVSAAASHSRTVFVLRAGSSHASVLAEFKKMQSELGTDNVFLTFDDTAAVWPHSPTIRMTEPRPSNGAPHVLLLNRTECQGMAGNGANWGECLEGVAGDWFAPGSMGTTIHKWACRHKPTCITE